MAWETAAPACPGGRATQCGNTDLAVRAGGIALPARPGPMDWPDTASRAFCGLAGSRASPAPGEVRSAAGACRRRRPGRSEEHTSELQSLMRLPYAVFCLKQKNNPLNPSQHTKHTPRNNKQDNHTCTQPKP